MIKRNLQEVRNQIEEACKKSGRSAETVELIAVSKTNPVEAIQEAIAAGQRHFGENRIQELTEKMEAIQNEDVVWHMIGTLQTNKIKYMAHRVDWIHSVPKEKAIKEIQKQAEKNNRVINILLQVNISDEDQKSGCEPDELPELIDYVKTCPNLVLRGFMGMATFTDDETLIASQFGHLQSLLASHASKNGGNIDLQHLSMGMSGDMEIAIRQGSTMVRVGSAIFGARS